VPIWARSDRCHLLGYALWSGSLEGLIKDVLEGMAVSKACRTLYCLNPHSVVASRADTAYETALQRADWLVPDGIGVVGAARLLCGRSAPRRRITGSDVFDALSRSLDHASGAKVFFVGSTPATVGLIAERVRRDWPRITVAGSVCPSFGESIPSEEGAEIVRRINDSGADVLWVGMTAPKQEKWIDENRERLACGVACAVGAVFDFYAGTFKRPGPLVQALGLEWAVRLSRDPRRLWKRTFLSAPRFAALVASELAGRVRR
jgi:N-acetylglucosaminyldiphosphoundecaprenol N-acetyl-beta-D-mannosaminyltransferase